MAMRIICLIVGFAFGSLPSGYLIAGLKGVDLRKVGSGNVGSTNVLRSMGRKYGALTLLMDMAKAVIPVIIMSFVYGNVLDLRYLTTLYTGLGAVLGHDFSPWLKFKGGKGVATSGGMILTIDPILFIIDFVLIFAVAGVSGYVSLGSIAAALVFFLFNLFSVMSGRIPGWPFYKQFFDPSHSAEVLAVTIILISLCIWKHRANILRLLAGTENKVKIF